MKIRIELSYLTLRGLIGAFRSDEMNAPEALLLAEDMEKTGRVKELVFIDEHDSTWTMKELKKYMTELKTEPHQVKVYFDGGFDLKTSKAGLGCAVYYEQNAKQYRLRKNAAVEELVNNNEAEYAALYLGLQELEDLGVHHLSVTFVGDSKVVINQLNEEWPCYEEELSKWMDRIEQKLQTLGITPKYEIVSRKMNRETDHLATQALNGIEITSTVELK